MAYHYEQAGKDRRYYCYDAGQGYVKKELEIKCCGEWINVAGRFTTTCDHCNVDYNSAGQLLAPRPQWGEETGEHWTECY